MGFTVAVETEGDDGEEGLDCTEGGVNVEHFGLLRLALLCTVLVCTRLCLVEVLSMCGFLATGEMRGMWIYRVALARLFVLLVRFGEIKSEVLSKDCVLNLCLQRVKKGKG